MKSSKESMLRLHEPDFLGLMKIISGGQCGADFGGIDAAYQMGVSTGGFAPQGYRTHFGPKPELGSKYGLEQDVSFAYPPRTRKNIEQSDGTLIIASNPGSPGCNLTASHARHKDKPLMVIQLEQDYDNAWLLEQSRRVADWITDNRIYVLNVAGNRDKTGFFHFYATHSLITWAMLDLHERGLLVTNALQ